MAWYDDTHLKTALGGGCRLLVRRCRRQYWAVRALRDLAGASAAIGFAVPGYRLWGCAALVLFRLIDFLGRTLAPHIARAEAVAEDPNSVYWIQMSDRYCDLGEQVIMHLRDGSRFGVALRRNQRVSLRRAWRAEMNHNVWIGAVYGYRPPPRDAQPQWFYGTPARVFRPPRADAATAACPASESVGITSDARRDELFDTLAGPLFRNYRTWRILCWVPIVVGILAGAFWHEGVPGFAPLCVSAIGVGVLLYSGPYVKVIQDGYAMGAAVLAPHVVYWLQVGGAPLAPRARRRRGAPDKVHARIHLCNGGSGEVCLSPDKMKALTAWLVEKNPTIHFGVTYDRHAASESGRGRGQTAMLEKGWDRSLNQGQFRSSEEGHP